MFELNHHLSTLDNLKNRLLYLTTLYDGHSVEEAMAVRKTVEDAWKEIYSLFDRSDELLDGDDFMFTHNVLYFFPGKPGETLDGMTLAEIAEYAVDLKNTARPWYYSCVPKEAGRLLSDGEIACMERINQRGILYFRPVVTALLYERLVRRSVSPEESLKMQEAVEASIRRHCPGAYVDSHRILDRCHLWHRVNWDVQEASSIIQAFNPRRDMKIDDTDLFKSFIKEVNLGYSSLSNDSLTLHLEPCSMEADIDTAWYIHVSDDGYEYEDWCVKVVMLYDHCQDGSPEIEVNRILRKVWITEGKEGGSEGFVPGFAELRGQQPGDV